jgi:hypothetical protein
MNNHFKKFTGGGLILLLLGGVYFAWQDSSPSENKKKIFTVEYQHITGGPFFSEKKTIGEALEEQGFAAPQGSIIFPQENSFLTQGTHIMVVPAQLVTTVVEGEKQEHTVAATTIGEALEQANIITREEDIIRPAKETLLSGSVIIEVIRVTVSEETEELQIPFKKKEEEDASLSWQTKKIAQKGEVGLRVTVYEVSKHNGVVVAKKKLREAIIKEPVDETTVVGTKVTVVKKHTGGASWYAHTGTLAAANPWLPFGSYVRVTNKANGKSVIVKINDRGPFGPGRIIDLDKVAFAKIADIGTGVIDVLMEEIK